MMKPRASGLRRTTLHVTIGIGMGLVLLGTSQAITSDSFKYPTAKTGFASFHHMDFAPDSDSAANDYRVTWGGGLTTSSSGECFQTGAQFPQGAKLKNIVFHYESGAGSEFEGRFTRYNMKTDTISQLAALLPADDSNSRTSVSESLTDAEGTVDNEKFTYGIGICVGSEDTFFDARVKYSYRVAGD